VTDDELLDAEKRAAEFCAMAEEYCPKGGLLFGDFESESDAQ
jgi:hypothetical protein